MAILSSSSCTIVRVTEYADLPSGGTAEFVIYCVDNDVVDQQYYMWKYNGVSGGWHEIFLPGGSGVDGNTILSGTTTPSAFLGVDGDFYINTTSNVIYGPKSGGWGSPTSLVGPQGFTGLTGPQGPIGPQGNPGVSPAGLTWQGVYNPATTYVTGDAVAYNGASYFVHAGPVTGVTPTMNGAEWALLGAQGAQGIQGIQGVSGSTILNGTTSPVGGNDGDFFLNTNTWIIYGPKAAGAWPISGTQLTNPWVMPKLTTAARTALNGSLTAANGGYQVYDTNLNAIFTWQKIKNELNFLLDPVDVYDWRSPDYPTIFNATTDFVIGPQHNNAIIYCNNTNPIDISTKTTIYQVEDAPTGFSCVIVRQNTGEVSFIGGQKVVFGVPIAENLYSTGAEKRLRVQYSFATLTRKGADWFLGGDLKV